MVPVVLCHPLAGMGPVAAHPSRNHPHNTCMTSLGTWSYRPLPSWLHGNYHSPVYLLGCHLLCLVTALCYQSYHHVWQANVITSCHHNQVSHRLNHRLKHMYPLLRNDAPNRLDIYKAAIPQDCITASLGPSVCPGFGLLLRHTLLFSEQAGRFTASRLMHIDSFRPVRSSVNPQYNPSPRL